MAQCCSKPEEAMPGSAGNEWTSKITSIVN